MPAWVVPASPSTENRKHLHSCASYVAVWKTILIGCFETRLETLKNRVGLGHISFDCVVSVYWSNALEQKRRPGMTNLRMYGHVKNQPES